MNIFRFAQRQFAKACFASLTLLVLCTSTVAADSTRVNPQPVSWQTLREHALQQSLPMAQAQAQQRIASLEVQRAKRAFGPSLDASASQSLQQQPFANSSGTNANGPSDTWGASTSLGLQLSQPLWTSGRLTSGLQSARLQELSAQTDLQQTQYNLVLELASLYAQAVRNYYTWTLAQSLVTAADERLRVAQARAQAGALLQHELLQLQADQANTQVQLLQAQLNYQETLRALGHLALWPQDQSIAAVDTSVVLQAEQMLASAPPTSETVARSTLITRDSIQVEAARESITRARSTGGLQANLSGSLSTGIYEPSSIAWGEQLSTGYQHRVAVGLSFPLLDRGQSKADVLQAQTRAEQAALTLRATRQSEERLVATLQQRLRNAPAQLVAGKAARDAAWGALQAFEQSYALGAISLAELLQQKNNYIQNHISYIQIMCDAWVDQTHWQLRESVP